MRQRKSKPDTAAVRKGKPSGNVHVGAAMQLAKCVELNAPTETMPAIEAMQTRTEANSKELSIRAEDATTAGKAEVVNSFLAKRVGLATANWHTESLSRFGSCKSVGRLKQIALRGLSQLPK